jgi:hypothetical protein
MDQTCPYCADTPCTCRATCENVTKDPAALTTPYRIEAPTSTELAARLAELPPEKAAQIMAVARPRPILRGDEFTDRPLPPPVYASWADFLARTTAAERRAWCSRKATKANGARLMSGEPLRKITASDVFAVLERAKGRCAYCGSLAVERLPRGGWGHIGRRIGSLGHNVSRFHGGDNDRRNLSWVCMWCNTWPEERRKGATDHGGHYPVD